MEFFLQSLVQDDFVLLQLLFIKMIFIDIRSLLNVVDRANIRSHLTYTLLHISRIRKLLLFDLMTYWRRAESIPSPSVSNSFHLKLHLNKLILDLIRSLINIFLQIYHNPSDNLMTLQFSLIH